MSNWMGKNRNNSESIRLYLRMNVRMLVHCALRTALISFWSTWSHQGNADVCISTNCWSVNEEQLVLAINNVKMESWHLFKYSVLPYWLMLTCSAQVSKRLFCYFTISFVDISVNTDWNCNYDNAWETHQSLITRLDFGKAWPHVEHLITAV